MISVDVAKQNYLLLLRFMSCQTRLFFKLGFRPWCLWSLIFSYTSTDCGESGASIGHLTTEFMFATHKQASQNTRRPWFLDRRVARVAVIGYLQVNVPSTPGRERPAASRRFSVIALTSKPLLPQVSPATRYQFLFTSVSSPQTVAFTFSMKRSLP